MVGTLDVRDETRNERCSTRGEFAWEQLMPGPRFVYLAEPGVSLGHGMAYLELDAQPAELELAPPVRGCIRGEVTRDGTPAAGVSVACGDPEVPDVAGFERSVSTDERGRFQMWLPVGTHTLVFDARSSTTSGAFIETRSVDVAAGREASVDVRWCTRSTVQLQEDDEPLKRLAHARVHFDDGRSLVVRPDVLGRLALGEFTGPCVIQACLRGGDMAAHEGGADREGVFAPLEGCPDGERALSVGRGALHVRGSTWPWPPIARVVSVNHISVANIAGFPPLRRRYAGEGVYVFDGIPAATEVELVHPGPAGEARVLGLTWIGEETRELDLELASTHAAAR